MALLDKFFPSRKKSHKQGYVTFGKNENESWRPFNFSKNQVRILLFRECDWRGRKLLFDSKAVQKVSLESQPCSKLKFGSCQKLDNKKNDAYVEVTSGFGYQYTKPNSDVTVLGEMIFGSVAMAFQGTVLKVHTMKAPSRVMCTKVFHSPVTGTRNRGVSDHSLEDSCDSSVNSMNEYLTSQGSCPDTKQVSIGSGPLDIELRTKQHYSSLEVDSGFYGDSSLQSASSIGSVGYSSGGLGTCASSPDSRRSSSSFLNGPLSCYSGGSLSSLQRRWLRNVSTSLECGLQSSSWSSKNTLNEDAGQSGRRRTKLGLAVVVSLTPEEEQQMQLFFFEHMAVMESMMDRLRSCVEHAYLHKEMFVHLMMAGSEDMQQWLLDVFSAPRLTSPVWFGLTSGMNHHSSPLSSNFLQDLCHLIANIDTKATNFFVSTLVTAVLTHHLGWVATVLPGKMSLPHFSKKPCARQLLDALSKSHPYNPLWAQLGELYGALGFPVKVAKTVVTSGAKKLELLNRILSSLTYFIRCSEVEKHVIERQDSTEAQLNAATVRQSSNTPTTALVDKHLQPSHSSFARHFLSGRDVMMVFDSRVDHGVEIGRELEVENGDKCNDNMATKSPVPSEVSSLQSVGVTEERDCSSAQISVQLGQSGVGSESIRNLRKDVHLSVPQISGMRRTASFMKKLDSTTTVMELEHSNPKSSTRTGRLYPDLADLKLDDGDETTGAKFSLHPEDKSSVADSNRAEVHNMNSDHSFHYEDMAQKVSRLCRVPTSAILCHLQGKDSVKLSQDTEVLLPKRVESERQRSCANTAPTFKGKPIKVSEESNTPSPISSTVHYEETTVKSISKDGESILGRGDVIFVIGDNEQLIDLKHSHKSETEQNEKTNRKLSHDACCDVYPSVSRTSSPHASHVIACEKGGNSCKYAHHVCHSDVTFSCLASDGKSSLCKHEPGLARKCELNVNVDVGKSKFQEEVLRVPIKEQKTKSCTSHLTSESGCRVITIHPSVIELEDECGGLQTNLSVKNCVRSSRSMSCSLSLLRPLSRANIGNNPLPFRRRHSDCICEISRYVKEYHSVRFQFERCEGVLMNYIQGRDQKKSFLQTDKRIDKVAEARENFCLTEGSVVCEKCSSVKKDNLSVGCSDVVDKASECCDMCVRRGEKHQDCVSGYVSEGNAMFDDYSNLSDDDDDLFDTTTSNRKAEEDGVTSTEQQQCETLLELPMPRCRAQKHDKQMCGFAASLMGGTSDHYIPDMVLHGCTQSPKSWEANLRRDLSLASHHSLLDQEVSEAVCIVANIDTWEVQLVSSHTYVVDKPGTLGIRVGMSRLVANMLESLLCLWRLKTSPEHCLLHLESKLRELFLRSQALAELLLTTEFCDMELLTTSLDLDANDVPLLLAVASTHTPQVTERYGLSFR